MKKILIFIISVLIVTSSIIGIYLNTNLINPEKYNKTPTGLSIFKNKKITIDIVNQTKVGFKLKTQEIPADTYLKLRYNNKNEKLIINSDINGFYSKTLYYSKFINRFLTNDLKSCKVRKELFNFTTKKNVLNFLITSEQDDTIRFDISKENDKLIVDFTEENASNSETITYHCELITNDVLITGIDLLIRSSIKSK